MGSTIVVYYSFEGNTGFAAETVGRICGAAQERLCVEKEPPKGGLRKFLVGGGSALRGTDPGLKPVEADISAYDNVILAYPIWAGTYPPAIGAFLEKYDVSGKNVYLMACSAGGNMEKSAEQLRARLGSGTVKGCLSLVNPLNRKEEAEAQIRSFLSGYDL